MKQEEYGICVVTIPKAKPNALADFGPVWLTERVNVLISNHLSGLPCSDLIKA